MQITQCFLKTRSESYTEWIIFYLFFSILFLLIKYLVCFVTCTYFWKWPEAFLRIWAISGEIFRSYFLSSKYHDFFFHIFWVLAANSYWSNCKINNPDGDRTQTIWLNVWYKTNHLTSVLDCYADWIMRKSIRTKKSKKSENFNFQSFHILELFIEL